MGADAAAGSARRGAAPWPWRWIATRFLPGAAWAAAVTAAAGLGWSVAGGAVPWIPIAAVALLVLYGARLTRLARLSRETGGSAGRGTLVRCVLSVLARAAGLAVLGMVAGWSAALAVAGGLALSLLAGDAQLARQIAIIETFRDA